MICATIIIHRRITLCPMQHGWLLRNSNRIPVFITFCVLAWLWVHILHRAEVNLCPIVLPDKNIMCLPHDLKMICSVYCPSLALGLSCPCHDEHKASMPCHPTIQNTENTLHHDCSLPLISPWKVPKSIRSERDPMDYTSMGYVWGHYFVCVSWHNDPVSHSKR